MNNIVSACGAEQGLITVDQALDLIRDKTQGLATKNFKLDHALNRYLAEDVYSSINHLAEYRFILRFSFGNRKIEVYYFR